MRKIIFEKHNYVTKIKLFSPKKKLILFKVSNKKNKTIDKQFFY